MTGPAHDGEPARPGVVAAALLIVVGAALVVAGIWSGDPRWAATGGVVILAVAAIGVAVIAAADSPRDTERGQRRDGER